MNSIDVNWATEEANITNSSQILRVSPTYGVHHVNLFLRRDKGKEYCFVDMDDDRLD